MSASSPPQQTKPKGYRSPEARAKISAAHKGKPKSEAQRAKMSAAMKVKWTDPEYAASALRNRPSGRTTVMRNYRIPLDLDAELRRAAAARGTSMTAILVAAARRELAEPNGAGK